MDGFQDLDDTPTRMKGHPAGRTYAGTIGLKGWRVPTILSGTSKSFVPRYSPANTRSKGRSGEVSRLTMNSSTGCRQGTPVSIGDGSFVCTS